MNDRIRELAILAVEDAAKYCQLRFDLDREENETFALSLAELIVRECIKTVHDKGETYSAYLIETHFGVE